MNCAFYFAVSAGHAAFAVGVVFAVYFCDFSCIVLLAAGTLHDVRAFQANFLSGSHAEIFLRSIFHEIVAFYPQLAAEFDVVAALFWTFRVVDGFHFLNLSFRIIGDDKLHRIQYCGYAGGACVQVFAYGTLQQGKFIEGIVSGITDFIDELMNGLG